MLKSISTKSKDNDEFDRVFKLARSQHELVEAFKLVYQSYFRAGLVVDNPSGMRLTPYHLLPDSEVFIAKIRTEVFSTISLFMDGALGLPMETIYPVEIQQLRARGLRIAEVGSLADRRHKQIRYIETLGVLSRLLAQVAVGRGVDTLVAVVHPRHARLYKRVLGFKQIGDHTECPYANGNPGVALYLRFADYADTNFLDRFFCDPIPADQLKGFQWNCSTRDYFERILNTDRKIAEIIGLGNYYPPYNSITPSRVQATDTGGS